MPDFEPRGAGHLLEPTVVTAYEMLSDGAGDRVRHWTGIEEIAIA